MKMHTNAARMPAALWPAVFLIILGYGDWASAAETLSLAGQWRFRLDEKNQGLQEQWYAMALPPPGAGRDQIALPGTTDEAKAGRPNAEKPTLAGPYRTNVYTGPAWYQREVEIPPGWQGKRLALFLERVRWTSRVWLDGRPVGGPQDSLIAPHVHDLGRDIAPGKHTLTIRVDNTVKFQLGVFVSALFGGTPTDMNGIVGRIELRASEPVAIDDVQVYPDVEHKLVRARVHISNASGKAGHGVLVANLHKRAASRRLAMKRIEVSWAKDGGQADIEMPMGDDVKLWDEFSPALYDLSLSLVAGNGTPGDRRTLTFGMRQFGVRGTQFTINGRPVFLRGTLECAVFPLTGYPPTDVAAWQRIYRIIKSYGLNFMRFHSWCPPEAAFAAADQEGVMLQVEGPIANVNVGADGPRDAFVEAELKRMVRVYGNHPSFCLMTLGNEYGGSDRLLSHWIDMLEREDPRHLYASPSCGQLTANRQFTEGLPRGIHGPGTDADFGGEMAKFDRPQIIHEVGQWTFYPNFDEMRKYTGVLAAKNFELVRDDLAAKHMLDLAPRFFQATGRQAVLLYKEEIEVLLRTAGCAGFSLLDLHDYPAQGTALIGPLDPFWDSKGLVAPQTHRQYCSATVPLLRMNKRTFTSDETFAASVEVAHFGPKNLPGAQPEWSIRDAEGVALASGALPAVNLTTGRLTPLGAIRAPLGKAPAPCKLAVHVALRGTPFVNQWEIWVYPAGGPPPTPADVVVSRQWDDATKAALAAGKKVVFLPQQMHFGQSLPGSFLPVFWSPVWFPTQKPNTMGILCDPRHPLFARFPTEFYSNWQWHDLLQNSRSLILDETPAGFRPTVQVIDNFARNHKLGNVFEARVGHGRLLVCTIDLLRRLNRRPAARQFLTSLYGYVASERFQPAGALDVTSLDKLFAPPAHHQALLKLGAKVLQADSEDREHGNLAAHAIDGDPDTFWHTRWGEKDDPLPHYLVIDLGRPVWLRGITYLPRQDMLNGRIRQAEIYGSLAPNAWGKPAATPCWDASDRLHTVYFRQPVQARYLKLLVKSTANGQPFAAVAELDVILADR
jgi:hypothetical protein